MKRFQFFAALLGAVGIGKAQQARWSVACIDGTNVRRCDPENNQCPVCGAWAEPFHLMPQYSMTSTAVRLQDRDIILLSEGMPDDKQPKMPSRLTRCKRCNAAFWQDAEK
jgi:predicted Ser/Thr protein kinase